MRARLFRSLLALMPRDFRSRFGPELLDTAASVDEAKPARLLDAPGILIDVITTLIVIRREMHTETRAIGRDRTSRTSLMDGIRQDVRFAARGLRRDLTFSAFVVAALTLGIGANAAMFGIADRLLLSGPPHIRDPNRVVRLYLTVQPTAMRTFTSDGFGYVSYDLVRRQSRSFDQVATYAVNDVTTGAGADARVIRGGYASDTLFPLLGVQPLFGRFFDANENSPAGASHVVVLSDRAWHGWFNGASDVLGRSLTIGGEPYVIVGVAPHGFTGPELGPVDVWLPMNLKGPATTKDWQTSWSAQWLKIVGRLAPGVTTAQTATELTTILQHGYTGQTAYVARGQYSVAGLSASDQGVEPPEVTIVRWLSGVALVVLVIACANVANLLLARGMRRSREIALRAALGAGRARIVRLLLIESLLLAFSGAIGGLGVAYASGGIARRAIFSWVDWSTSPVDARVLVASGVLAILTGALVGLLPAWRVSQVSLGDKLKRGAREGGGQRSRLRHALTIVQAALSVVLLIGAGLFVRSLWNVRTLPLGFDPDRVLLVEVSRASLSQIQDPAARAAERARRQGVALEEVEAIRKLPGVERASAAVGTPFGNRFSVTVRVPGLEAIPRLESGGPSVSAVAADYFATVGTRILRGRAFGPEDRAGSEPVAIVSDTMARTIWPNQDALGLCLISGESPSPPCARIVGIAEDTHRDALRESAVMHYYVPFGQEVDFGGTVLVVRPAGNTTAVGTTIRRTLLDLDSTIRYVNLATIQDAIDPQTKPWRIGAAVFVLSGVLALLVAAIGMYSVMSYLVADRTREIGVRLALGASAGNVARLILLSSVGMATLGIGAGSLIAAAAGHFVEPLLFNEHPRDPIVFLGVGGALIVVALAAGILPTLRANRIDPLEALRVE